MRRACHGQTLRWRQIRNWLDWSLCTTHAGQFSHQPVVTSMLLNLPWSGYINLFRYESYLFATLTRISQSSLGLEHMTKWSAPAISPTSASGLFSTIIQRCNCSGRELSSMAIIIEQLLVLHDRVINELVAGPHQYFCQCQILRRALVVEPLLQEVWALQNCNPCGTLAVVQTTVSRRSL